MPCLGCGAALKTTRSQDRLLRSADVYRRVQGDVLPKLPERVTFARYVHMALARGRLVLTFGSQGRLAALAPNHVRPASAKVLNALTRASIFVDVPRRLHLQHLVRLATNIRVITLSHILAPSPVAGTKGTDPLQGLSNLLLRILNIMKTNIELLIRAI